MVKLTYKPKGGKGKGGHLAMVGKGIMYDSGGINLKPAQGMQLFMKMDMAGAAAVLGAMSVLRDLDCPNTVTAFLMCTDNMPSGSATKMGDVLTHRNGKTVEIHNTDAEGRLILADGLALAAEMKPDAIINIGTLTGAILAALGEHAHRRVLEPRWLLPGRSRPRPIAPTRRSGSMPLDRRYRKQIDSAIADLKNMGDAQPGSITAALYLEEFVDGIPWTHFDICGTMKTRCRRCMALQGRHRRLRAAACRPCCELHAAEALTLRVRRVRCAPPRATSACRGVAPPPEHPAAAVRRE